MPHQPKVLLLDIETAPHRVYAWGLWGQDIATSQIEEHGYTLCWAAKWLGEKQMHFRSLFKDKRAVMLRTIYKLIDEADVVVHYNGTKFDMPTLNQEFLVHLRCGPPAPYKQVDLLLVARRRFRLASNKLDYVAKTLGIGQKVVHKGMALWRGCMAGEPKSWRVMERYNRQDVRLLENLYGALLPWIPSHPNRALWNSESDEGSPMCPTCGSTDLRRKGFAYTRTMRYQRFQCKDCGSWMRVRKAEKSKGASGGGVLVPVDN
jgi:hypothetical protein